MQSISMPKALGGSKAARKTNVELDDSGAWLPFSEMCRVTGADPQTILESMPDYRRAMKLVELERTWPVYQALYSAAPRKFEAEANDTVSKMVLELLQNNRRPVHVLAMMDLSMIKFLIQAKRSAPSAEVATADRCVGCGAQDPRLRCAACKEVACINVLYCTKACQISHWKKHKAFCCKNTIAKAEAERLQQLMRPVEQADDVIKARVEALSGIMDACAQAAGGAE